MSQQNNLPFVKEKGLAAVTNLAQEMTQLDTIIKELEETLKAKRDRFNYISSVELPDLMAELQLRDFRLFSGERIKVLPVLKVSVTKDQMNEVDDWLKDHGHDGMVKTKFEIPVPSSNNEAIIETLTNLIRNLGVEYNLNKSINWQTLNKWGREMEAEGSVIPEEIFNVFRSNITVIE